ncbi:hypothetical protein Tco_0885060 [Tanacetum coccineum]
MPIRNMALDQENAETQIGCGNGMLVLVWFQVRAFTGMSSVPPRLVDVLAILISTKGSSVSNVISRIVLAAMTYCLWYERNSRLFKKKKSTVDQIV